MDDRPEKRQYSRCLHSRLRVIVDCHFSLHSSEFCDWFDSSGCDQRDYAIECSQEFFVNARSRCASILVIAKQLVLFGLQSGKQFMTFGALVAVEGL